MCQRDSKRKVSVQWLGFGCATTAYLNHIIIRNHESFKMKKGTCGGVSNMTDANITDKVDNIFLCKYLRILIAIKSIQIWLFSSSIFCTSATVPVLFRRLSRLL